METKPHIKSDRLYLSLANLLRLRGKNKRELIDIVREGATNTTMVASGAAIVGNFAFLISQTEYLGPFARALELSAMCAGIGAVGIGLWRIYGTIKKYQQQA